MTVPVSSVESRMITFTFEMLAHEGSKRVK